MDSLTYYTSYSQMFDANVLCHHPMGILVHALVLYLLVLKSVTIVAIRSTTWLEIRVELVKEMVPGQEVIHLVSMVGWSIHCSSYLKNYLLYVHVGVILLYPLHQVVHVLRLL